MIDQEAFDAFLFEKLRDRAELVALIAAGPDDYGAGVYPEEIPQAAELPAIVYDAIPGADVNPQGKQTQLSNVLAVVRCLSKGTEFRWDVAREIDLALNGASAVVDGYRIHCERVSAFRLASSKNGAPFRFAGGRYRLTASHPLA
ncbi:MAG: tail completion protein gp17 [Fimbriimonas sp.]